MNQPRLIPRVAVARTDGLKEVAPGELGTELTMYILELLIEFDELQSSGQDDSPRINEVSYAMDAPWDAMTAAERDFARKVSAALNEAWVEP